MKRPLRLAVLAAAAVAAGLGATAAATSRAAASTGAASTAAAGTAAAGTAAAGTAAAGTAVTSRAAAARTGLLSAQDQAYLTTAHRANLAEIDAGRVGQRMAASPVVRRLAAELVADHTRLDRDVVALSQRLQVSLPTSPSATQLAQLAAVAARSGAAFDTAWLQSQLAAHQEAMAAGRTELERGSDTAVRTLAERCAPVVQSHLTGLEQALGGGTPTGVDAGTGGQAARLPAGSTVAGRALLGVTAAVLIGSAVLFGPRRRRAA